MSRRPKWSVVALASAGAGVAITSAIRLGGRHLRARTDAELDDPLSPPTDVVHHHLATHDGGSLHVVDSQQAGESSARPVVLMHGVTLQWWVWSAAIRLLRSEYRVLAWDMRGHGESKAGTDGATLEATAHDLELVIRELDLHDAVLVGHSMGGMTIGRFAAERHDLLHERVAGVVFVATSAAPLSQAAVLGGLVTLAGAAARIARRTTTRPRWAYPWHEGDLSAVMLSAAFGKSPTARMIDDVRRMEVDMASQEMAEAAASIATHDVRDDLHRIDIPTVVLVGTHDKLTPPVHAREIADLIEGAELEMLPGIGHQIMQEDPAAIVRAVDRVAAREPIGFADGRLS